MHGLTQVIGLVVSLGILHLHLVVVAEAEAVVLSI
jgi:hypothetical protein